MFTTTLLTFSILALVSLSLNATYCVSIENGGDFSGSFSTTRRFSQELEVDEIVVGSGNVTSLPFQDTNKNSLSYGFMFDITAFKTIDLTGLYFYTDTSEVVTYSLFTTTQGDYSSSKHNIKLWSLIAYGTADGQGIENPTKIEKMKSISIPSGTTIGVYLTLQTQNLIHLSAGDKGVDNTFLKNDEISVSYGSAIPSYPIGDSFLEPKSWCGILHYYVLDYPPSDLSVSPTLLSSNAPSLSKTGTLALPSLGTAQSKIPTTTHSIVPNDLSMSLAIKSNIPTPLLPQSSSKPTTISKSTYLPTVLGTTSPSVKFVTFFPVERLQSLRANQRITLYGTNIGSIDKSTQQVFSNELTTSLQRFLTDRYDNLLKINYVLIIGQTAIGGRFNEVDIIIDASYNSSKEIEFSTVTQTSINEIRQTILTNLQEDASYFQNVERIASNTRYDSNKDYTLSTVNHSLSLQYPDGYSITEIMNSSTVIRFEDVIQIFCNHTLSNININSYIVMAYLTSQEVFIKDSESLLDVWIAIHAKYATPPLDGFNLSSSIQWIFNNNDQELYHELIDSEISFFKELEGIQPGKTITIDNNDESNASSKEPFFKTKAGYVVISFLVLLFIVFIMIVCFYCGPCFCQEKDEMMGIIIKVPCDDPTSAVDSSVPGSSERRESFRSVVSDLPMPNFGKWDGYHSASTSVPGEARRRDSCHSTSNSVPGKIRYNDGFQSTSTSITDKMRCRDSFQSTSTSITGKIRHRDSFQLDSIPGEMRGHRDSSLSFSGSRSRY